MADIELLNLVTTRLIQNKKEIEYSIRELIDGGTPQHTVYLNHKVDLIIERLDTYSNVINQIQLWESLLDDTMRSDEDVNNKK